MQSDFLFRHSGQFSISGLFVAMTKGAAIGIAVGALYAAVSYYSPFFVINMLVLVGVAIAVGYSIEGPVRDGNIRNGVVAALVGAFTATVTLAAHWVIWLRPMTGEWILDYAGALSMLEAIAAFGAWSVFEWTPRGGVLYTIWALEALLIFLVPTVMARNTVRDTPFCETSGKWAEVSYPKKNFAFFDVKSMGEHLRQTPSGLLGLLKPPQEHDTKFTRFGLGQVGGSNLRTVSISTVSVKVKDGKVEEDSKTALGHLIVDVNTFDKMATACE